VRIGVRRPVRGGAMSALSLPSPGTPDGADAHPGAVGHLAGRTVPLVSADPVTGTETDADEYSLAFATCALCITLGILAAVVSAVWVVAAS